MNIPAPMDTKFKNILTRFGAIAEGNISNNDDKDIALFFMHAEGLFKSWKLFFNSSYSNNIKKSQQLNNYLCDMIKRYLPENGNGSWNGMERQEVNLCKQPVKLIDAFIDILNFNHFIFPDYDNVKELLYEYADQGSSKHVSGMGTLLATSLLFVFDENSFMVLDRPVKTYFNINDDKEGIDNYDKIITYSQNLAAKYKLSMWAVNKAYAVYINGGKIKIFDFCNNNSDFKYIKI